jgi:glutamyl-Q tRNA(Asp) synthetase
MRYRGRFAPSPTGPLHWGSLCAAWLSWVDARRHAGQWLIRIEDLDPPREIAGMAQQHIETLKSFGLESDEEIEFQSQRHWLYREALNSLIKTGHAFACRCTRSQLEASQGIHRDCIALSNNQQAHQASYRLKVPDGKTIEFDDRRYGSYLQSLDKEVGDVVLLRADGYWAYQLAVVVDDAEQGITHVVRGEDLLDSTPRQIYLQQCLGISQPDYLHLPLIKDTHGRKLSKSDADQAIDPDQPLQTYKALVRYLQLPSIDCDWQAARSVDQFLDWSVKYIDVEKC